MVTELHFQCNVLWKHPNSQYLCYLHPSEFRAYTIYTFALLTSKEHVWRKASTWAVLSEPSRGLHVYRTVPRQGWDVPPAALVACGMLEPRSSASWACCTHSVLTQENFPAQRQGHRGRKAAGEGWDERSEWCYRCRKESLAIHFCLQLFTKNPYNKRNKPATFKFVREASFVFISSLHSVSKGLFFFFLLITTSVHSKDGKEFSLKEKTVKLFQSQQGWITRKPLDSTVAPTQSFWSLLREPQNQRKRGKKASRKLFFPASPAPNIFCSIFKRCPRFLLYLQTV